MCIECDSFSKQESNTAGRRTANVLADRAMSFFRGSASNLEARGIILLIRTCAFNLPWTLCQHPKILIRFVTIGWPRVASKCAKPPTFKCFAASQLQDMRPAGTSTPMALSILISSAFSPSFLILFALRRISYEVLKSGFGPEYTQFAWGRYGSARRCSHFLKLAEFFIELHGSPFFACGVVVVHSRI